MPRTYSHNFCIPTFLLHLSRGLGTAFIALGLATAISACGDGRNSTTDVEPGGGSKGPDIEAPLNDENSARAFGKASAEVAHYAKVQDDARKQSSGLSSFPDEDEGPLERANRVALLSQDIAGFAAPQQKAFVASEVEHGNCGGTASGSGDPNGSITISFDHFCEDGTTVDGIVEMQVTNDQDGTTTTRTTIIIYGPDGRVVRVDDSDGSHIEMSGQVTMIFTSNTDTGAQSFGFNYVDFTYTDAEGTYRLNMVCDMDGCHSSDTFTSSDGENTYRTERLSFAENAGGFTLQADRVYDESFGYVGIETRAPLTFCSTGYPASGEFLITAADDAQAIVIFSGCAPTTVKVLYKDADGVDQALILPWPPYQG